jgi:hypothetical protein
MSSPNDVPQPIISIDFKESFPYKIWISTWSKDESYPIGFRYKLLSVRNESSEYVELVIVLEEPGGYKTEMKRMDIKISSFDDIAWGFVRGFEETYGIEFQVQDFSEIKTKEQFDVLSAKMTWHPWKTDAS